MSGFHRLARRSLALLVLVGCEPTRVDTPGPGEQEEDDSRSPADDTAPPPDGDDTGCDDPATWYRDRDGDGYGDPARETTACELPNGYSASAEDCDDRDADVHPDAEETCDGADNDCDGESDEGFDEDKDGYTGSVCEDAEDCDDTDATVHPGAEDACADGLDADCDGADERCGYDSDLASADALVYATERAGDAGRHMDVGDLDGDGLQDVVVGAMWADSYTGKGWVVYGPVTGTATFSEVGYEIAGGPESYEAGRTVGVGDTNGDGFEDVLLGAPDSDGYDAVIAFGPIETDMEFDDADVRTWCESAMECGHGGDLADIDGDGQTDAIIAAGEDRTGGYDAGAVYLLIAPVAENTLNLRTEADHVLTGTEAGTETGRVLVAGGDLDGDGIGDLLIAASYDSEGGPYAGAVYVVYGPIAEDRTMDDADGKLLGAAAYDYAGESLTMGDIDGDGLADAGVGAYASDGTSGKVFLTAGPAEGKASMSSADLIIEGVGGEALASSLASGDVDADGKDDLLVGAGNNDSAATDAGAAYLYFGPRSGTVASADADVNFTGASARDSAGGGAGLGDLNGDGQADILIGATGDSTGANAAGALYIVRGGDE